MFKYGSASQTEGSNLLAWITKPINGQFEVYSLPILIEVTRRPQALRITPMLLAVTPFPRPLTTPPDTKTYFIFLSSAAVSSSRPATEHDTLTGRHRMGNWTRVNALCAANCRGRNCVTCELNLLQRLVSAGLAGISRSARHQLQIFNEKSSSEAITSRQFFHN